MPHHTSLIAILCVGFVLAFMLGMVAPVEDRYPAAVELFHAGFWYPTTDRSAELPPDLWANGLVALGLSLVALLIGQFVFRRLEGRFAQVL